LSVTVKNPIDFVTQLPKNLIANIAYFIFSIIIGIFLVPYFIETLGVAAYGLIPLATSLMGYVTILTDSLNVALSRFLTVDLHQGDYVKANKTFNTAFFGLTGITIMLIPILVLLSFWAPKFFNIPTGQESEVVLLFLGVFAAFLIRSLSSNFTVSLFAYNRLTF
jgi:O-antigen/teichoic acid export membrane protein